MSCPIVNDGNQGVDLYCAVNCYLDGLQPVV